MARLLTTNNHLNRKLVGKVHANKREEGLSFISIFLNKLVELNKHRKNK